MRSLIERAGGWLRDSPALRRLGAAAPPWIRRRLARHVGHEAWSRDLAQVPLEASVLERLLAASRRETEAWKKIQTLDDWKRFISPRIEALHHSLGLFPSPPEALRTVVTGTHRGLGFSVENVVFESRPRLLATANLYRPAESAGPMPGILICHSHHNPKTQDELREMGTTWARLGCTVLIMDLLGHGERREHPFVNPVDFAAPFRLDRQDYWFRYNLGMQLHLIGDSLMGWMVWDLMRGVDLLLSRPAVDPDRLILIGSVAGGGDVAAVTAALDRRISAVIPFGFGSTQRKRSELPAEPQEEQFNYAGTGSWESTRNLRLSARDGFLPWVILSAVAPRHVIYAHEFGVDLDSDPVWERLKNTYELHGAPKRLAVAQGRGSVSGQPPYHTHCNNVGRYHREQLYPILERWFDLPSPEGTSPAEVSPRELQCLTKELSAELQGQPAHQLAAALGASRLTQARRELARLPLNDRRERLLSSLQRILGDIEPEADPHVGSRMVRRIDGANQERVVLVPEPGIAIGLTLLLPPRAPAVGPSVVIGIAQGGSGELQRGREKLITGIMSGGVVVCLADLRGAASSRHGYVARGRPSLATEVSSSELMLGQTAVGAKLKDLRSVLRYLRSRQDLDGAQLALWGDSLVDPNPPQTVLETPFDAEPYPMISEPLGGLLAVLGAVFEPGITAAYVRGGLISFASILESPFCHVPSEVVVPDILTVGDLCDLAASLAPTQLRMRDLVDGLNRRVPQKAVMAAYEATRAAYDEAGAPESFVLEGEGASQDEAASWLLACLRAA